MAERKNILLRLDPAVHDALAKWAADEMRSTNAQIEFLLRRALNDVGRMPGSARQMRRPGRPPANTGKDDGSGAEKNDEKGDEKSDEEDEEKDDGSGEAGVSAG